MGSNKTMPTYKRQRFLLALAQKINEPVFATDFQKIMFLCMMQTGRNDYEFVPYKYGPYSFQLAEDVNTLRRSGFLSGTSHKIVIANPTPDSETEVNISIPEERGDALMRKTYRAYPYYTINSEILQRLFGNNPAEMNRLREERNRLKQEGHVLFTIGYEGRSIEAFLNTLIKNDIRVLCDVRKNPLSRKYGFSKEKLEQVVKTIGIQYVSFSDLGIDSEQRQSLETESDYKDLFLAYQKNLPHRKNALDRLYNVFQEKERIALMCFEKDPQMCHRHVIRDYLCAQYPIRSADL